MAYGQTGSGKSFSMQEDPDHIGIIPRAIVHVFQEKEADEDRDTQYFIHVSYVEIYNEEIRDLLSETPERKLDIKNNAVNGMYYLFLFKMDEKPLEMKLPEWFYVLFL